MVQSDLVLSDLGQSSQVLSLDPVMPDLVVSCQVVSGQVWSS